MSQKRKKKKNLLDAVRQMEGPKITAPPSDFESLNRIQQARIFLEKIGKQAQEVRSQLRPLRIPRGYLRWDVLADVLTLSVFNVRAIVEEAQKRKKSGELDWSRSGPAFTYAADSFFFSSQEAMPAYALQPNLIVESESVAIDKNPDLLRSVVSDAHTVLFLLPKGHFSIGEDSIDHLFFHCTNIADRSSFMTSFAGVELFRPAATTCKSSRVFEISFMTTKGVAYSSSWEPDEWGSLTRMPYSTPLTPEERELMQRLKLLVTKTLLFLKFRPTEFVEAQTQRAPSQRREQEGAQQRPVRKLGMEPIKRYERKPTKGTRASPVPHIRILDPSRNPRWREYKCVFVMGHPDEQEEN